jgi:A/G-specific adenine glycosylase
MKMEERKIIVSRLLEWFRRHGRSYPWRENTEPYRVLIAEIMLQRTRADQVLPVYRSFLEKFPDPTFLAEAKPEEIEEVFAKLGLKWRAEKVKNLARVLVSEYDGRIPDTRKGLLSLPGVGEYAADAVLCFAYGRNATVIDANVCRVIERLFGLKPIGEARRDLRFRRAAQRLVPKRKARELNWAIIDLAAIICTPKNPKCDKCPLEEVCLYKRKRDVAA